MNEIIQPPRRSLDARNRVLTLDATPAAAFGGYDGGSSGGFSPRIDPAVLLKPVLKYWPLVVLVIAAALAGAIFYLQKATPIYVASALVEVKQEESRIVDFASVDTIVADKEFLLTQVELMRSVTLAESVISTLDLMSDPFLRSVDNEEWASWNSDRRLRHATDNFREKMAVTPLARSRLIQVSFEHPDPVQAARIVNTLTETFIARSQDRRFESTGYARQFLTEQLETVKASLEGAERDLVQYAIDNNIILIENDDEQNASGSLDAAALADLDKDLVDAQTEFIVAETNYRQALEDDFNSEILANDAINRLKTQRVELNSEYIEKLATFKPDFPQMRELKSRIDLFDSEIEKESELVRRSLRADAKSDYDLALARLNNLANRVDGLKTNVLSFRENSIEYNIRKREVETERAQYDALLSRLKEISLSNTIGSSVIEIVDIAKPPLLPSKPRQLIVIPIVLLFSLGFAFAGIFLLDRLDDRLRTPDDILEKLKMSVLGVIPVKKSNEKILETLSNPQNPIAEAYASVRTSIEFSMPNNTPRTITVTSSLPGEGKSTTSLGVALRKAGAGKRTLLIDADMRLPTFKGMQYGLSDVLMRHVDPSSAIVETNFDNLDLLSAGRTIPNPSELLSNGTMKALLKELQSDYDCIVIDGPPVLGLADALLLGEMSDVTVMVAESRRLTAKRVRKSINRLMSSGTNVIGIVLTKFRATYSGYGGYYNNAYSYGAEKKLARKIRNKKPLDIQKIGTDT